MKRMLIAASVGILLQCGTALGQGGDFYKGRQVDLYVGYSVGGGYDIYARLLARHMGEHLPGKPVVVPKNMAGAGSLRLANWLYQAAPRDGSAFGTIGRGIAFDPLLGGQGRSSRRRSSAGRAEALWHAVAFSTPVDTAV